MQTGLLSAVAGCGIRAGARGRTKQSCSCHKGDSLAGGEFAIPSQKVVRK